MEKINEIIFEEKAEFNTNYDYMASEENEPYIQYSCLTTPNLYNLGNCIRLAKDMPVFENNTEAKVGKLEDGQLYRNSDGTLKVVF